MTSRFWVGGTGTWDSSTTTHWAASTGGAGGQTVPTSADTVTFDGASGGGTVTVNFGGLITLQSLTTGAFTGTLDFSANNNSVTLTASVGFNGTGTGLRTINLGNGTWTLTGTSAANRWTIVTPTNLTFNANSSTIAFTGAATGITTFAGGGLTYSTVTFAAIGTGGCYNISGANTFSVLSITGKNSVQIISGSTQVITTLSLNGTSSGQIELRGDSFGQAATVSVASNAPTMAWTGFRDIACTGGATFAASNSADYGNNSGITITPPSVGAGGPVGQQSM